MAAPTTATRTGPAGRTGRTGAVYQALANISVPWAGENPDHRTDLVMRGNPTRMLTDEEAEPLLNRPAHLGGPVIRKIKEASEPLPAMTGRTLSGPIRAPGQPAPGTDGPRPDPAGSSQVYEIQQPELAEPQAGTEQVTDDGAVDLPPRGSAGAATTARLSESR